MRIVFDYPPLFDEINAQFQIAGKAVIFAWGDLIYNPMRITIPVELMAHEAVHGRRQSGDIEGWWRRYVDNISFRLAEELPAHREEYRILLEMAQNRQQRRACLKNMAVRFSNPLYGPMLNRARARELLLDLR